MHILFIKLELSHKQRATPKLRRYACMGACDVDSIDQLLRVLQPLDQHAKAVRQWEFVQTNVIDMQ